jgi:hypothetical protein
MGAQLKQNDATARNTSKPRFGIETTHRKKANIRALSKNKNTKRIPDGEPGRFAAM